MSTGDPVDAFLARCASYCKRRGISEARLSTIILRDGKRLRKLREGAGIQVDTLRAANARLDDLFAGLADAA